MPWPSFEQPRLGELGREMDNQLGHMRRMQQLLDTHAAGLEEYKRWCGAAREKRHAAEALADSNADAKCVACSHAWPAAMRVLWVGGWVGTHARPPINHLAGPPCA